MSDELKPASLEPLNLKMMRAIRRNFDSEIVKMLGIATVDFAAGQRKHRRAVPSGASQWRRCRRERIRSERLRNLAALREHGREEYNLRMGRTLGYGYLVPAGFFIRGAAVGTSESAVPLMYFRSTQIGSTLTLLSWMNHNALTIHGARRAASNALAGFGFNDEKRGG